MNRFARALVGLLERPRFEDELAGMPFEAIYPAAAHAQLPPIYRALRSVASVAGSVVLAPANPARTHLVIVNESTSVLYVTEGPVSSSTSYTRDVGPGAALVLSGSSDLDVYRGDVSGAWSAVNGFARITER